MIIASSDFIHYGLNYGYMPFRDNVKENLTKLDIKAFEFIRNKDPEGFLKFTEESGATICGKYPIAILLDAIEGDAELLCHYSSGDIVNDYRSCVDYMSIIFR